MVDSDDPEFGRSKDQQTPDGNMMPRLRFACERITEYAEALENGSTDSVYPFLIEELQRLRNILVLLENSALTLLVEEILAVFTTQESLQPALQQQRINVLNSAVKKLNGKLDLMESHADVESGFSLLPLINDCRSITDDVLLSDTLMLSLGLEPSAFVVHTESKSQKRQQYDVWASYAAEQHTSLMQRLLYWWGSLQGKGSSKPLIRQLDRFSQMTDQYACLQPLTSAFQSCAIIAEAVESKQLDHGPAIKSLFSQLERCVHVAARREMNDDLVPADLLRNCLYYVSQVSSEHPSAVSLRRRFRLDCLRHVQGSSFDKATPVIGAEYHVLNAIRIFVSRETSVLRTEFPDQASKLSAAHLVRVRVRLEQLQPLFSLIAGPQALRTLQSISTRLNALDIPNGNSNSATITSLAAECSELDSYLENLARSTVLNRTSEKSVHHVSAREVFLDIASDACLTEAKVDIQDALSSVRVHLQSDKEDTQTGLKASAKLLQANNALQVLPLPEVGPLLRSLATGVEKICSQSLSYRQTRTGDNYALPAQVPTDHSVASLLLCVSHSIQDYLTWVFQPQPSSSEYLHDAEDHLEHLLSIIDVDADASDQSADDLVSPLLDDLSLPDIASLTLDVDDELLLDSFLDDDETVPDGTLRIMLRDECLKHVVNLEQLVQKTLRSSTNDIQLPDESMLRALHGLTNSAQTMEIPEINRIVQPLQRVSLLLHRQGKAFDGQDTVFIGKLVSALRSGLLAINADDNKRIVMPISDVESRLTEFVARLIPGEKPRKQTLSSRHPVAVSQSANDTNINYSSALDEQFDVEASELLDVLRSIVSSKSFNTKSVQSALSILHTLKGSARMLGVMPISECAHDLEARVLAHGSVDDQLRELKAGHRSLHSYLLQATSRRVGTTTSSGLEAEGQIYGDAQASDQAHTEDQLLDLATELTSAQALLNDELTNLGTAFHDFEITTTRWQQTLVSNTVIPSSESAEIFADVDATRTQLRDSIQKVIRQQHSAGRVSANLQQAVVHSRLVRFDEIRHRLNDTIEELARICGVSARLEIEGGELMIDKLLFKQLHAPLEHMTRNAVVHGIERAEERLSKSKSSIGCIQLSVFVDGESLIVSFSDDGRGLDRRGISQLMEKQGQSVTHDPQEIEKLLVSSGFSTVEKPDSLSGHGLGLSAVAATVARLKGHLALEVNDTVGFSIKMRIPQKTIVSPVLIVECDRRLYGIPIARVQSVMLDKSGSVSVSPNPKVASVKLLKLLGARDDTGALNHRGVNQPTVNVQADGQGRIIAVDKIVGYRELVVQPLGRQLSTLKHFSSASVLPGGRQVLILQPDAFNFDMHHSSEAGQSSPREITSARALVVDDSPTSRSIVQNMLEERGVRVQVCKDGLHAIKYLSVNQSPDIMFVDLEMPRLNGFGLMRRIYEDFPHANFGIVAISSREDEESRVLASKLGAIAYLSKPFTNQQFSDAIKVAGVTLPDLTIA